MTGKVIELFLTQNSDTKTRLSVESIQIDTDGIIGDKFYAKDPMRAILLSSQHSYTLSSDNSIPLETGALGENILIDINPYSLVHGDRLKIGDTELEITQNCTLCKGLSTLNSKLPKLLKNDRGIFAKIINGNAEIHIGDKVEILNN
jgi:MOSC domain-containing protein YiiM